MTIKTRELSEMVRDAQVAEQRFGYYHQKPGWFEGLGTGYSDPLEALEQEGHDALIRKVQLSLELPGYGQLNFDKHYGLVREPTIRDPHPRATGVVSNRFQPIQQRDVAEMLQPIATKYPLEMIAAYGAFNDHVVWGFRYGEFSIKPPGPSSPRKTPDYGMHWLYVDHVNNGTNALRGMLLNLRIECTNVLPHAESRAKFSVSLPHVGNASRRLVDWAKFLESARLAAIADTEMYQWIAKVRLTKPTIEDIFGQVYHVKRPDVLAGMGDDVGPDTPDDIVETVERYLTRVRRAQKSKQAAIVALDTFNDRNPQFANTGWAVLQGVTEVETWRKGRLRGYSLLFGDRALTINKAAAAILEAAK